MSQPTTTTTATPGLQFASPTLSQALTDTFRHLAAGQTPPDYILVLALPDLPAGAVFNAHRRGDGYEYRHTFGSAEYYFSDKTVAGSFFFEPRIDVAFEELPLDTQFAINLAAHKGAKALQGLTAVAQANSL